MPFASRVRVEIVDTAYTIDPASCRPEPTITIFLTLTPISVVPHVRQTQLSSCLVNILTHANLFTIGAAIPKGRHPQLLPLPKSAT